jgi:phenylpyruvate tautomerase PptA (4-oxalocrotonate tautomerase family)
MPFIRITTMPPVAADRQNALLKSVSKTVSQATGKPESVMMVALDDATFLMDGVEGNAVFVDVRGIGGLSGNVNVTITRALCALFEKELQIPPSRIYLTFTDVAASHWGWNNRTFG